jgi:S-adenosylmethionine:tRNA ribosyltransferase-isomerase
MIAAGQPIQRPPGAKLLIIDASGRIDHALRSAFVQFLRPGDLVIANDAATLPASLCGAHVRTGARIEVRLAGRHSLAADDIRHFFAVVFGSGDFRMRTEDRPPPPALAPGDRLALGSLSATVEQLLGHARLVSLCFDGSPDMIWAGLARHGRPIQYAHIREPLALWDVWTSLAGAPVAFEPPSAGFALNWQTLRAMRARGVTFATITHAAGISSTGDADLDQRLPLDEPYRIPLATVLAIRHARARGDRIVAIGTTVVRALEHAASGEGQVRAGEGLATQRIDATSSLRVVDAILSGVHEPGTCHYRLLEAFTTGATLDRANDALVARRYRTHEFGDSVFIERQARESIVAHV